MSEDEDFDPELENGALAVIAKSIAEDLHCTERKAMEHARNGVIGAAKHAGLKLPAKPTDDDLEELLAEHWEKIQVTIKKVFDEQKKRMPPPKKPGASGPSGKNKA